MRLVFALLALGLTSAAASADTITRVTRERIRVDRAPRVVVQQAPVFVQQAPPVIVQQAPRVYMAPAPQLQFAPAAGCYSPSQAAAFRAAQLRMLGY